ncbi:hypothetical protein [Roseimicrobium sp. ORNL1]|uniref:hypothetical protein n=1 Tax=Roseimicrobium sp. ORNL1 TaxID=2711231 RepID=UPI0013E20547|nr:hypothetical protein [Roseimicrobium sp. ORNL1]QIF03265.1 hypothetical protein G5S37_17625 [Roseimicrobium sp. ORNL1]
MSPEPPGTLTASPTQSAALIHEKREGYREALDQLAGVRRTLQDTYASTQSQRERTHALEEARAALTRTLLNDIFPAWYGTKWDFNGISEVPGEGAIACGYFVTTTLRDAGFKLPRIKLAQQPSQTIIRSLCDPGTIRVYHEKPLDTVVQYLREQGPGLYIVGLDCHTGFVVNEGTQMRFIHSSYFRPPLAVISESLDSDHPLRRSKYRMIGKLLGKESLLKWLQQQDIPMIKQGS